MIRHESSSLVLAKQAFERPFTMMSHIISNVFPAAWLPAQVRRSPEHVQALRKLNDIRSMTKLLPPEILSLVFQHACPPYKVGLTNPIVWSLDTPREAEWEEPEPLYRFLFILAGVSHYWRQVVFSTPELWKAVSMKISGTNVDLCAEVLATFLKNVGEFPFSVDLDFTSSLPPPERDNQPGFKAIHNLIFVSYPQKISFIRLASPAVKWLEHFGEEFTNLEEIHLKWSQDRFTKFPGHISFIRLPRLCRLKVYNFSSHEFDLQLPASRMTHLDFYLTGFHVPLKLLLQCHNLVCFRNRSLRYTASPVYDYEYLFQTPYVLPHLTEFDWELTHSDNHNSSLFNFLHLPSLRKLFLNHLALVEPAIVTSALKFFSRFQDTLVSLTLHHAWAGHRHGGSHPNSQALVDCLGALPHIREFAVKSACPCFNGLVMEVLSSTDRVPGAATFLLPELKVLRLRVRGMCELDTGLVLTMLQSRRELDIFVLKLDFEREFPFQLRTREGLKQLASEGLRLNISIRGQNVDWLVNAA
ncbi:hypothetical protein D9756_007962 [Leucocoprinus leucothites]|uniref:F-box domain-containing protein n=1 Tax=Leucocoprinus leucothites TaxID=201217 RepID=A0A8H5D459_9AGAR|nr:hypothetical protein D9756_007962 [Leucoagaricus leucothites]